MRALLSTLALVLLTTVASAQTDSVVITFTPDGYALSTVSDAPLDADRALLLTHTDEGGWRSRMLSTGDVPSEVLATESWGRFHPPSSRPDVATLAALFRVLSQFESEPGVGGGLAELFEDLEHNRGVAGRLASTVRLMRSSEALEDVRVRRVATRPASSVRYTVWWSRVPVGAVPALLADVEDEAPFTGASVQAGDDRAEVELSFSFRSVEAWTEWTERVRLDERFASDPSVRQRTSIEVSRSLRAQLGDVIGDGEIIDMDVFGDDEIIDDIGDGEIIDDNQ